MIRVPSAFRAKEKAAWRELVEQMGADAVRPSDVPLLRSLAILIARLGDLRLLLEAEEAAALSGHRDLPYLMQRTERGYTANPLLGQERETIKEIRLLHERLERILAARGGASDGRPKSLRELRTSLQAVPGRRKASG